MPRIPDKNEQMLKAQILKSAEAERAMLLFAQPFIGSVLMRMELVPVVDSRLATAATDGKSIFIDCGFYRSLKTAERLFLLAHETWHCLYLHFFRQQKRQQLLWNIAADLEIQFALDGEKRLQNPSPLPYESGWNKLSAEEIYEKLRKSAEKSSRPGNSDVHLDDNGMDNSTPQTKDAADCVFDPDYAPCINKDTAERIREYAVAAAQECERRQGKLPAHISKLLKTTLMPKLRWQELLAQFVTGTFGGSRRWLPPSRRHVGRGVYLPSLRSETLKAVVAIDTSGSTLPDRDRFFTELTSLFGSFGEYEITVIECDAEIGKVTKFDNFNPIIPDQVWTVTGGGGTDFRPVFEYVEKEELECPLLIFFTDGYGDAPATPPAYPVLWLLTGDGNKPCEWGWETYMEE